MTFIQSSDSEDDDINSKRMRVEDKIVWPAPPRFNFAEIHGILKGENLQTTHSNNNNMLSRFFSSYTGKHSKRKRDKEVSLIAQAVGVEGGALTLKVGKGLLLEHSATFREMSRGELKKCGRKIALQDVTPTALRKVVEYMQNSSATFLNHSEAVETLTAADKYKIDGMSKICVDNLIAVLEADNVCDIYEASLSPFSTPSSSLLQYHCLKLVDKEAEQILKSRGFSSLKKPTVLNIIKRTSLNVNAESSVFNAVLGWGLNACLRQGGDPNDTEKFLPLVRYLFNFVRFAAMTDDELADPEVHKYHQLLTLTSLESHHLYGVERTTSSVSVHRSERSMSTTSSQVSVPEQQPRRFVETYRHQLDLLEWDHHQVKSGETFSLGLEVLKGKVFVSGLNLAFKPFAATKKAACLYVSVSATNESTSEQRSARGTFSNSGSEEEASLSFGDPLPAVEADQLKISLNVKRAENICLFVVKRDVQIAMPESKAVALKVTPCCQTTSSSEVDGMERCILKGFEYFF